MTVNPRSAPSAAFSGSSFYWALRLMPRSSREAMFALYAFCREVDDIADGDGSAEEKRDRLAAYAAAVEALFAGGAVEIPVVAELAPLVAKYGLAKADLRAIVEGMMMDASEPVRIPDEAAFDLYLDRVASAVGRLSDRVFGLGGEAEEQLAHHLGRALQITNILRDLREDAARGRLYLPCDVLAEHGIGCGDPGAVLTHPHLEAVLRELARRARDHYAQARGALDVLDRRATRPARAMLAVYQTILDRLEARGLANIDIPVRLGKPLKMWLAFRHGWLA